MALCPICKYQPGGKDNFAADREAAEQAMVRSTRISSPDRAG